MRGKEVVSFLEKAPFRFAKTMVKIPHSWICRKDFNDSEFLSVMNFIKNKGYVERFFNKEYIYLNVGKYKYWVMTNNSGFNDRTAIINRAEI